MLYIKIGCSFQNDATEPFGEQAEVTVATNFTGTVHTCEKLFPLLRPHARVVNVSSRAGDVEKIANSNLKTRLISEDLTMDELKKIMNDFVSAAKRGTHKDVGFPNTAYGMSKIGLTAATRILQRDIAKYNKNEDIIVNACCPGYVDTDMTSHKGTKTIEEGADTPIYLALLPPQDGKSDQSVPKGNFVAERRILDWTKGF
ncbi:hypothetical protein RvY_07438-2 [Ramazzottius varieornatus]|uniref:Carbonyl reductase [NADPH] 1 n=1 Tax=Ramazzottius varieornatus TaxID=947166 RepID=A0A1D1VAM1_RAMVA|nr:hypothetical protein RvY_07438-2 [Ramazzottius varieornatus]